MNHSSKKLHMGCPKNGTEPLVSKREKKKNLQAYRGICPCGWVRKRERERERCTICYLASAF